MENFLKESMDYLAREDGEVSTWLLREYQRQQENIELIASENITSPAVMAWMSAPVRKASTMAVSPLMWASSRSSIWE